MREIVSAIKRLEKMENRRAANAGGELWSGWQPVGDTWTYASSTTFTISGDVTDYYCVGMFVKWTQSATVKYGIITNATYSDPNTTITIEGDAVANETISGNYVSRAFAPQGATHSQVFTGVLDNLAHGETAGKYLKSDGDNSASFVTFPDHDHTGDAGDGGVLSTYLRLAYAERRGMMFHDQSLVTAGSGAIARYLTTSQSYGFVAIKASASNGDKFSHGCFLRAGTYKFVALGTTASGRGKLDWYVDGAKITSTPQDWYSASVVYDVEKSVASVSISTSGWHKIEGLVNGKNASSSGYAIGLTAFWFVPASD